MSAVLRIEDYVGELPKVDFGSQLASSADALAGLERSVQKLKPSLDRLLSAAQDMTPEAINAGAADLLAMEQRHAEILVPRIREAERRIDAMLRAKRSHTAAEKSYMRQYDRFADALVSWLESLRDTRIRLHLLASEKMREAGAPDIEITDDADLDRFFRSIAER